MTTTAPYVSRKCWALYTRVSADTGSAKAAPFAGDDEEEPALSVGRMCTGKEGGRAEGMSPILATVEATGIGLPSLIGHMRLGADTPAHEEPGLALTVTMRTLSHPQAVMDFRRTRRPLRTTHLSEHKLEHGSGRVWKQRSTYPLGHG